MVTQLRKKSRLIFTTAALALCLSLQSCFTTGLWASGLGDREKASLTPLSVALDALTLPAQIALIGHGHHHGHRHGHRGHRHRGHRRKHRH